MGLILIILGVLVVILGLVQHFTAFLGSSVDHLSIYIGVVGAILIVVGAFLWMRGRSAAA
jgi:hypothetical protein